MKNAYKYFKSLPIDFTGKATLLSLIFNYRQNISFDSYKKLALKEQLPDDFAFPENPIELMMAVNRQVKHEDTPSFIRNRFYSYKNRLVKQFIKEGRVSDIWSEGYCYSMVIDGQYHIHQLKSDYGNKLDVLGERPYKHDDVVLPLNMEQFEQFQIAAVYYLSKCRYQKYGNKTSPSGSY